MAFDTAVFVLGLWIWSVRLQDMSSSRSVRASVCTTTSTSVGRHIGEAWSGGRGRGDEQRITAVLTPPAYPAVCMHAQCTDRGKTRPSQHIILKSHSRVGSMAAPALEVRRPRAAPFTAQWVVQAFAAVAFASYFFFWMIGVGVLALLAYFNVISTRASFMIVTFYMASLLVYKPQFNRGWYFGWFLYSPFVDWCLGYYDATAVREGDEIDPNGKYLFAMVPHGIFGVCRAFSGGSLWRSLYPGITARWGSFGGAFYLPGVREFSLCCGCLDAGRPTLTRAILRGENVMLLPGGSKELLLTDGGSTVTKLVLLDRTGFVRLAIEYGLDLVPGFCFGEKWAHDIVLLPQPLRRLLYHFRLAGAFLIGRWGTFVGKVSRDNGEPLSIGFVWGPPIKVEQQAAPSAEYVAAIHAKYCAEIERIFETHKSRFGYAADETLELVSAKEKSK